ncbi:MAG: hypothetical protein KAI55_04550, partial [Candidatus Aenigmarchaeota archaeon]|nr:hypothetical protein [Candidatus Aenigmarchaeota archaeon]
MNKEDIQKRINTIDREVEEQIEKLSVLENKPVNEVEKDFEKYKSGIKEIVGRDEKNPTIMLGDGKEIGPGLKFKSNNELISYCKANKVIEENYQKLLKIIKNIKTDEKSRKELSQLLNENGYKNITPTDLEECYYLNVNRYKLKNTRGIMLFPLCIVVPDRKWEVLSIKFKLHDWSGGCSVKLNKINLGLSFTNASIIYTAIHEELHNLFDIIEKIENIPHTTDKILMSETIAYRIADGYSFEEIEKCLLLYYLDNNSTRKDTLKDIREGSKYEYHYGNLIVQKLIPVAKYLDKNYPRQFFDIFARAESIEGLFNIFKEDITTDGRKYVPISETERVKEENKFCENIHKKELEWLKKHMPNAEYERDIKPLEEEKDRIQGIYDFIKQKKEDIIIHLQDKEFVKAKEIY